MSFPLKSPTVFEGTREEIVTLLKTLPEQHYRVEVVSLNGQETVSNSLDDAIQKMTSRTPEQIIADRLEILAESPRPTPLPPGKTLEEMVAGQWPGDETDEEIQRVLEELS